jgi:hypothetical protein
MRTIVLALLLLPVTAFSQFEDNPVQQELWEGMTNTAPAYEMLLACERDVTADLVWEDVKALTASLVGNQRDIEIAMEMWREARTQAQIEYHDALQGMSREPNGEVCNNLEDRVIRLFNQSV